MSVYDLQHDELPNSKEGDVLMTILDQIKERMAYQLSYWEDEPSAIHMSLSARMVSSDGKVEEIAEVPLITCKDCKYYELEDMYEGCCMLHFEHMEGYDPLSDSSYDNDIGMYEMPSDGFCSSAERRDVCATDS